MGKAMDHAKRRLLLALAAATAGLPLLSLSAGKPKKRIYLITYRGQTEAEKGFFQYFAERNLPVEFIERDIHRDLSLMPGLIAEIRATRPDLIYCWGTPASTALLGTLDQVDNAKHITDIPVVFTMVAAPVAAKLVANLESSERNFTGVYHVASSQAQISAMRAYRDFKRLGILYTPTEANSLAILAEMKALGSQQGFEVIARPFKLDKPEKGRPVATGVDKILSEIKAAGAQWLYLPPDSFLATQAAEVIPAAHKLGLPTFASAEQFMEFALAGLISRYYSIGQFTAYKAAQILFDGAAPQKIPIETLSRYSFLIRLSVAKQLHLLPPLTMFNSAEFVPESGDAGS